VPTRSVDRERKEHAHERTINPDTPPQPSDHHNLIAGRSVFESLKNAIRADRPATVLDFLKNFYNYDVNGGKLVSDRVLEDNWNVAAGASPIGTLQCVDSWVEDFRQDIAKNTVPTLIIHGDADRILPPDATSRRQAKLIKHVKFAEIAGGPHGLCWTHADRVNAELVPFV
jgi:non-heme chloroperoxidase